MNPDPNKDNFDFSKEVVRSMLYRGEYDQVYSARAAAYKFYGGVLLLAVVFAFLFRLAGFEMNARTYMVIVGAILTIIVYRFLKS